MNVLRLVGGLFGALLLVGSFLSESDSLSAAQITAAAIGAFVLLVALIASDKVIDKWFGGL